MANSKIKKALGQNIRTRHQKRTYPIWPMTQKDKVQGGKGGKGSN